MMEFAKKARKRNFWEILLKNEFNSEALGVLAAHLCWKNLDFSKKYGKLLIRNFNKIGMRELLPCLTALPTYLCIQDEFQSIRIEWMMGFPDFKIDKPRYHHGEYKLSEYIAGA
jgi:hypothetical protein